MSQIFTVDKADLADKIGTLSSNRLRAILAGFDPLLEPWEVEGLE